MIMILHETVSMANPIQPAYDGRKDILKAIPIPMIQENRLPGAPPTGYMINGASAFNMQWPSHRSILSI